MSPTQCTAATVRAEAARRNITSLDLGRLLGLSRSAIHRRMRGHTPFTAHELNAIAMRFDMPLIDLVEGTSSTDQVSA